MALVVFLRGVNVGGHRTFKPTILAKELSEYGVVNVGAAGTFVVHKAIPRAQFEAALRKKLPFETGIALCDAREFMCLKTEHPFGDKPPRADVTRFVSVLSKAGRLPVDVPFALPSETEWLVRLIGVRGRFVFGEYRRHMKTIGYLGRIDKLFEAQATTRNWNTVASVIRILEAAKG